jgi:hypothetical protein
LDYATIKYVEFLYGDADGEINLADAVYIVNYLFINGPAPQPLEAGDANFSDDVDLADAVYLVNYLFIGGPPPCERWAILANQPFMHGLSTALTDRLSHNRSRGKILTKNWLFYVLSLKSADSYKENSLFPLASEIKALDRFLEPLLRL